MSTVVNSTQTRDQSDPRNPLTHAKLRVVNLIESEPLPVLRSCVRFLNSSPSKYTSTITFTATLSSTYFNVDVCRIQCTENQLMRIIKPASCLTTRFAFPPRLLCVHFFGRSMICPRTWGYKCKACSQDPSVDKYAAVVSGPGGEACYWEMPFDTVQHMRNQQQWPPEYEHVYEFKRPTKYASLIMDSFTVSPGSGNQPAEVLLINTISKLYRLPRPIAASWDDFGAAVASVSRTRLVSTLV